MLKFNILIPIEILTILVLLIVMYITFGIPGVVILTGITALLSTARF